MAARARDNRDFTVPSSTESARRDLGVVEVVILAQHEHRAMFVVERGHARGDRTTEALALDALVRGFA